MKKVRKPAKVSVILDKEEVEALDRIVKKGGYRGKSTILRALAIVLGHVIGKSFPQSNTC
ncbi:MAG: ribbon-helix-helix protein, CopG family [Sulfolobus sp.]|nr:ribbon-helix-helix protein, CopG family [Sulfolobus sp.]